MTRRSLHAASDPPDPSLEPDDRLVRALELQSRLMQQGDYRSLGQVCIDSGLLPENGLEEGLRAFRLACLSRVEIFAELGREQLAAVAELATQLMLPPSQEIIRQQDPGDSFFLIISGRVQVFCRTEDGLEVVLNELEAGDSFGEMALLTGQPRSASVRTLEPVNLLVIAKNDFDALLQEHPALSRAFLRTLTAWLAQSTAHLAESTDQEKAVQRLLLDNQHVRHPEVLGRSRPVRRLKEALARLAAEPGAVLIVGEEGTEKRAAAFEMHRREAGPEQPFVRVDLRNLAVPMASQDAGSGDRLSLELAQKSALFGHLKGSFSFAVTKRMGCLQIADQGTLLLENLQSMEESVQRDLLRFLSTGRFSPLGSQTQKKASARLVATADAPPDSLAAQGRVLPELLEHFRSRTVEVPPLRVRKRDLKVLVETLLAQSGELFGTSVQGISREAFGRLLAYHWPGNFEELENVLRRAVSLSKQKEIGIEEILLGPPQVSGRYSFDLLTIPPVRSFLTHRLYPRLGQILTGAFFLLILAAGLLEGSAPWSGLATQLTWGVWEPVIVLSTLLVARQWCAVCPIRPVIELLSRSRFGLRRKVPRLLRNAGVGLSLVGLGAIIWAELVWDMHESPWATALLILSIAAAGAVSGLLFQRLAWCRYLCPLGRWIGVLAACSCVELRANQSLCLNECRDYACYRDPDGEPVCPVSETPFSQHTNLDCLLCSECLKRCTLKSPRLNLRVPGYELLGSGSPNTVLAAFIPVLLGTQLARGLARSGYVTALTPPGWDWLVWLAVLLFASLAAWAFLLASARLMFPGRPAAGWRRSHLLSHGLLPLVLALEAGLHLPLLLEGAGGLLPGLGAMLGLDWSAFGFHFGAGAVRFLQGLGIAAGVLWSLLFLRELGRTRSSTGPPGSLRLAPAAVLALVFMHLLG